MELVELERKFQEAVNMIEKKGREYADARALYNYLYELRKVVLADRMKVSSGKSVSEKEMLALCTAEYKTHLESIKEAEGSYLRSEAEYCRWKSQFEAARTLISLEKQKMQIL